MTKPQADARGKVTMGFSRREFLAQSVAAAGALWAPAREGLAQDSPRPLGLQLYTVAEPMRRDLPGTLKKLYDIGFREVETAGFGNVSAQAFRQVLDRTGLRCVSCHVDFEGEDWGARF